MHSPLYIINVFNFSMTSYAIKESSAGIICERSSRSKFIFDAVDHVYISNLNFFGCKHNDYTTRSFSYSTRITLTASNLILLECTFEDHNRTSLITGTHSNIVIAQCTFRDNYNDYYSGPILIFNSFCNVMVVNSTFIDNKGELLRVKVDKNLVVATVTRDSINTLTMTGCEFRNNDNNNENAITDVQNTDISIVDTKFINNSARNILSACKSIISIDKSAFKHNYGSATNLEECTVDIFNSLWCH